MKRTMKLIAFSAIIVGAFAFGRSFNIEFPELNAAKNNLLKAKENLNKAATDFGGHKAKSLEYLDKAVKEIDEAILYGDKH
jgi:hypothetical protein